MVAIEITNVEFGVRNAYELPECGRDMFWVLDLSFDRQMVKFSALITYFERICIIFRVLTMID